MATLKAKVSCDIHVYIHITNERDVPGQQWSARHSTMPFFISTGIYIAAFIAESTMAHIMSTETGESFRGKFKDDQPWNGNKGVKINDYERKEIFIYVLQTQLKTWP